jgi:hypothetical protein
MLIQKPAPTPVCCGRNQLDGTAVAPAPVTVVAPLPLKVTFAALIVSPCGPPDPISGGTKSSPRHSGV